jgi:hypothetical protein
MPDALGFSDDSIKNLGRGIARYFINLYPLAGLSFTDRVRGLIEHYATGPRGRGGQKNAAAAIGVSPRTLRRWARGTTPIKTSQARVDRAYLAIHLDLNNFRPRNTFEARMASAFSAGQSITELGRLAEHIMTVENKVPKSATFPRVPDFTPGMDQMWAPECTVSDGDGRDQFPFNVGNY